MYKAYLISFWLLISLIPVYSGEKVNWVPFNEGLEKAAKEKKYILIDFYADWCNICTVMDNTTFKEPTILAELSKNYVSIKINTESSESITWQGKKISKKAFAGELGVYGLPTYIFMNAKAEIIGSYSAYADKDLMLNMLQYVSSGARERQETLQDFLKKQPK
ncbi:MAG: thioredoxin family protein [Fibrobacteria bacterium]|nr:thioredoxin family protein [Fibrobacteria bacterium]